MKTVCVLLLVALSSATSPAVAQSCEEGPSIVVRFGGQGWDPNLSAQMMGELVAAARLQGFAVCSEEDGLGDVVARVELTVDEPARVVVAVEVFDEVTNKRLRRDVDLSGFADDSRALALAVAVDELLRASWMELALASRRAETGDPPPPAVARVVERELAAATPRHAQLGVIARVVGHSGGVLLIGPELYASYMFIDEIGAELSLGVGFGLTQTSLNGTITARGFGGELALLVRLFEIDVFSFVARGGVRVVNVEYEGVATAPAVGRTLSGIAVIPSLGVVGALSFDWFSIRLGIDVGGVARAVGAADDGVRTYAVEGVSFGSHLALGARL